MVRDIVILVILCTSLVLVIQNMSYANTIVTPADMQSHIQSVRHTNPGKYQAMMQKAGGNIASCCSCHEEICKKGRSR